MSESTPIMALVKVEVKQIPLHSKKYGYGHFCAIVDAYDFEWLSAWRWKLVRYGKLFYARRTEYIDGKPMLIGMHAQIVGFNGPDHKDRNGLNNRRNNLRP